MDKVIIIDKKRKKEMGIICFIPAVAFFISLVYYIALLLPLAHGYHEAKSAVGITSRNYTTMLLLLASSATISAAVLLYLVIYIVRIKSMNTPKKMIWMLLLLAVPVSFILFWFREIRHEPKEMAVYGDIG